MSKIVCDLLVVGGGVAGLAAGIAAARNGLDTLLIEKEAEIGFKIRGEVVKKEADIFKRIFGGDLPEGAIVNDLTERRIYSPSVLKHIDAVHTESTATIDYRLFIIELFKELSKTSCKVFLNTELVEILNKNEGIDSVRCRRDQEAVEISAKYYIGADGAHSKFASLLEPPTGRDIYPALKMNYENIKVPNPHRIELYLMTEPAGAMWMFPKTGTAGECGIVPWTKELPQKFDIWELWKKKSREHAVLSEILRDAKPYYISRDYLNFGGPMKRIFGADFVVAGDSAGHIGAVGGSGIISGMSVGYNVAEFVAKALRLEGKVTEGMIKEFLGKMKRTPIFKFLKSEQKLGKLFREIMFGTFKTNEVIDENWYKLENIYGSARNVDG